MQLKNTYLDFLYKLINSTKNEKISWISQNPTTFYFTAVTEERIESTISIQRHFSGYTFSILRGKSVVIRISSIDEPEYTPALSDLYESIQRMFEKRTKDFLDDISKSIS